MLKLKFGPFIESNWNHPMNTPYFNSAVKDYGIEVVEGGQDISFQDLYGPLVDGPMVGWDRRDTSRVTPEALKEGELNPDVLGYCVPCLALDPGKSTALEVYKHKAAKLGMEHGLPTKPVSVVTTMLWSWLECPWTKNLPTPRKDIRASFCGTVYYCGVVFTEAHRKLLAEKWPLNETFAIFNGRIAGTFSQEQLYSISARSKVVVSPWGVTEVSIRDYESVAACAMTIKPEQSEMRIFENPWHKENTVYCKPDWSNLEECIQVAEDRWNAGVLQDLKNEMLKAGRDIKRFAELFVSSVREITG